MKTKSKYNTKQKQAIIDYFKNNNNEHICANDVCRYFIDDISKATIYRQLEQLVDEGILNKYIIDGKTSACFEFYNHDHCDENMCFHFKCERCGKLIHLHCDELIKIETHLFNHHNLKLNPIRTVFYGTCKECDI